VYSQEHRTQWEDNFSTYKVDGHRHLPEIKQNIGAKITFIPHLLPIDHGIIATCYLKPKKGVTSGQIKETFMKRYLHENFVEILDKSPNLKDILGTNLTQIYFTFDANGGRIVVIAALDNLTKGASGQAVQNMNLMFGLEEEAGLKDLAKI
jgi:N-acetyl-gamma-glutamyl-phosphate reductase